MPGHSNIDPVHRIIDANINRAKEGLRVCEEITRFILNDRKLTAGFKKIRHSIDVLIKRLPPKEELLSTRKSSADVGRTINAGEFTRRNYRDIFCANIQRVKESVRVLEEFSKLSKKDLAIRFKKIRYEVYEIEKKASEKISALRINR